MTTIDPRALDLLIAEVTEGLSDAERAEMHEILGPRTAHESGLMSAAAAAIELAHDPQDAELPPAVRLRARARLMQEIGQSEAAHVIAHPRAEDHERGEDHMRGARRDPGTAPRSGGRMGWWLAAAATIAAVISWWPRPLDDTLVPPDLPRTTAEMRRDVLLETAPDALRVAWQATEDAAATGASGDVVWSPNRQTGFMRFAGLPANDPAEYQYQLWIFDATRDERYPIDGGVFDIGKGGEVVIPIAAKLAVRQATLFAVTIEKPGGVVVSSRERLVLLAQAG